MSDHPFPAHEPGDTYPLWSFETSHNVLITRGRTRAEAAFYLAQRHTQLTPLNHSHILAAACYSTNHAFNWYHCPPHWLVGSQHYYNIRRALNE